MRAIVYSLTVVAAIGIMMGIAAIPTGVSEGRVMDQAGSLTLAVPTMSCTVVCYPAVKEALESSDVVASVALDVQKEEGLIDNRQIIVTYKPGFNVDVAIALLAKSGFANSSVIQ